MYLKILLVGENSWEVWPVVIDIKLGISILDKNENNTDPFDYFNKNNASNRDAILEYK